jgi:glycerol-3-phosphate O-acyltransferase
VLSGGDVAATVVQRVTARVLAQAEAPLGPRLDQVIAETVHAEQSRLERSERDHRGRADARFTDWLSRQLADRDPAMERALVHRIVDRYTREISGHFDPSVYALATRVVPAALSALLHGLTLTHPLVFDVADRIRIDGESEMLRALTRIGTVILAPTHVSNLDSVVFGSVIHQLGLPPFAYGAGLNLFSNVLIGFFMRHLGAYTVDRQKTDPLYRLALKEYTTVLLERGQHNLFFPGGTRSRSGAIESHLKKGLLGTAPVAFRHALASGAPRPRIFVFPCTVTYPLVLEADTLIDDYLRAKGGAHHADVKDDFDRARRWVAFLRGLLELDERVFVRISWPLDWLGNRVDAQGTSRESDGLAVDPVRYLLAGGRIAEDAARDASYTRALESRLLAAYRRDNTALPTSIAAFALFERLRRSREEPDVFRFVLGMDPGAGVPVHDVLHDIARLLEEIAGLEMRGEIRTANDLPRDPRRVLEQALGTFTRYHRVPVMDRRGDRVVASDPRLLFYYRNRLEGYGLLDAPRLLPS